METSSGKKGVWAKIISFDLGATGSKKVKFYRQLFGFHSTRRRGTQTRRVFTPGILSKIPHLVLGKSVVAVPPEACSQLLDFLSNPQWKPIQVHVVDGLLSAEQVRRAVEEFFSRPVRLTGGEVPLSQAVRAVSRRDAGDPDRRFVERLLDQLGRFEWLKEAVRRAKEELSR
ncbi:MAG: hypothetical protein QW356_08640 [Candidatus Hadarchaeales archaeon]